MFDDWTGLEKLDPKTHLRSKITSDEDHTAITYVVENYLEDTQVFWVVLEPGEIWGSPKVKEFYDKVR